MLKETYGKTEEKMEKAVEAVRGELLRIRTGRATPSLLDGVKVECYGSTVPLNQVASIGVPEPRTILIQPWDKSILEEAEKAILKSDLGLTPSNDGNVIRLSVPPLTEERRRDLVKLVKRLAEEGRVAIRNVRREANERVKEQEKEGRVSEDEGKRAQKKIQELTDSYIEKVDAVLEDKEEEIMEV